MLNPWPAVGALAGYVLHAREHGAAFRLALSRDDVLQLRRVQATFLLAQYAGVAVYYGGAVERPTKFPASLSFIFSRGPPKHVNIGLWLCGWTQMGRLIWTRCGDPGALAFVAQMVCTGLLVFCFNAAGQSRSHNLVHMAGSALYIADHVVLLEFLDTSWPYRAAFYVSFVSTGFFLSCSAAVKEAAGLPQGYASSAEEWRGLLRAAGPWRLRLWCSELAFMVCENLIFTAFTCGMHTGLPEERPAAA